MGPGSGLLPHRRRDSSNDLGIEERHKAQGLRLKGLFGFYLASLSLDHYATLLFAVSGRDQRSGDRLLTWDMRCGM